MIIKISEIQLCSSKSSRSCRSLMGTKEPTLLIFTIPHFIRYVLTLTMLTAKYFCLNHGDQTFFFNLKSSFEYLCYGSTAIINIDCRRPNLASKVGPCAERVQDYGQTCHKQDNYENVRFRFDLFHLDQNIWHCDIYRAKSF